MGEERYTVQSMTAALAAFMPVDDARRMMHTMTYEMVRQFLEDIEATRRLPNPTQLPLLQAQDAGDCPYCGTYALLPWSVDGKTPRFCSENCATWSAQEDAERKNEALPWR